MYFGKNLPPRTHQGNNLVEKKREYDGNPKAPSKSAAGT